MTFAKFQGNRFRIDGEIAENHAILVDHFSFFISFKYLKITYNNEIPMIYKSKWQMCHNDQQQQTSPL